MLCPYNHKTETTVYQFSNEYDAGYESNCTGGQTVTKVNFTFASCAGKE